MEELRRNCAEFGITFFDRSTGKQGIVHIVGPEQGITQPGTTIACGDSHTSTHGAFGAIAFGIGTTQIRDVLATQTMALGKLKVRRINVTGRLRPGVYAKDVILHIIRTLGRQRRHRLRLRVRRRGVRPLLDGGAHDRLQHVDRGRRPRGLRESGRDDVRLPEGPAVRAEGRGVGRARSRAGASVASDAGLRLRRRGRDPRARTSRPPSPGASIPGRGSRSPRPFPIPPGRARADEKASIEEALAYMKLRPGAPIKGTRIDVAFLGSCTNGRLSDFQEVARYLKGRRVAPGSQGDRRPRLAGGRAASAPSWGSTGCSARPGFEWREAGCSMCLAMNPDKLVGDQLCASSSNRNFKGRQGSPTGRTILMSPLMVAAAAVTGAVADAREVFGI